MALHLVPAWVPPYAEWGYSPRDHLAYNTFGDSAADDPDDEATVLAFAQANVPGSFNGHQLSRGTILRIAPGTFYIECEYVTEGEFRVTNEHQFTFDTRGGTQHITYALSHVHTYNAGSGSTITTSGDGFLNISADGTSVEGLDRDVPGFNFQTILYLSVENVDDAYISLLKLLTDTVNSTSFSVELDFVNHTFAAGEVRFLGATGALRSYGDVEITLSFNSYPNQDGVDQPKLTIGPISNIVKRGQDYLSVRYAVVADNTTNFANFPQVLFVSVDVIYPYQNWTGIIPT